MLLSYLRLVLFAAGLLIGVQVPGFINDYAKRVEAHLIEAQTGLRGFQGTAEQFFKGDLQALVAHYRASDDPVFRSDADSLSTLLNRQLALDKQFQAMQGPWYIRFLQVVLAADPDIRKETWNGYSYQILLTPEAMIWGMSGALLLSFGIECLIRLIDWVVLGGRRLRQSRPIEDRDVRGL
ncbi:DUF2937 family protein [Pseudomonas koreensis]|jgi:hypothetical protein|uniref:DUF2937 family protein n=1 Tax=Pseudomonas fluorescens TaxID=294 RepID=A0A854XBN8_PSEFL|nr:MULTISPECIES: DUF2937 family protein [Pseudomonas]KAA8736902.1 DUF2937 family protein [Pseudomonas koreensis]PCM48437.1 hypothetical protein CP335_17340 [Pseudomonas fluorescens]POA19285.1 DUF2937 domain-containing protein [Pseudomonas sp. FW305-3-2-15-E-TSA4]POA32226.1 DUF2937 domain-containing protein [Pseudomonas sp. FW305-3-2-15-E-TSA2]SNY06170.1 Protein of unknown function [Pseudomonas sp. LAMO17WK12:I5]